MTRREGGFSLIEILTVNKLHYSHGTESGVLFHLIGASLRHETKAL